MKTRILSFFLSLILTAGITVSVYAANADYTLLNNIKAVNKIEVHGNVELFISDGPVEQVRVYNKYYSDDTFAQPGNGVLKISSYNAEKLIVWVSTDELNSISLYDNAEVKSVGALSKIEFDVDLHNNATAKLDLDAYSANANLTDRSNLELKGNATEFSINHNDASIVTNYDFSANHYYDIKTNAAGEIKSNVVTNLE
jgi:hypothetical protein